MKWNENVTEVAIMLKFFVARANNTNPGYEVTMPAATAEVVVMIGCIKKECGYRDACFVDIY